MGTRVVLVLALTLAASGCGARTDLGNLALASSTSDSGPTQPSTSIATSQATSSATVSVTGGDSGPYTPTGVMTAQTTSNATCTFIASNYDQGCTFDSDCGLVSSGNVCGPCVCPNVAINKSAVYQYNADRALAPPGPVCNCPAEPVPCCRQGLCTTSCQSTADTLPACATAGGTCIYGPLVAPCDTAVALPLNSCAYDDEVCCIPVAP